MTKKALNQNAKYVQHREKEIHNIVQSISDLNTIFKELGSMVTEQVKMKASIFFFDSSTVKLYFFK